MITLTQQLLSTVEIFDSKYGLNNLIYLQKPLRRQHRRDLGHPASSVFHPHRSLHQISQYSNKFLRHLDKTQACTQHQIGTSESEMSH